MDFKEYALKLLSFSDRTESELRKRLSEKGCGDEEAEAVVAFLKEYGYIDDARYARRYAADSLKLKGHGPGRIRADLLRKGIDRELAYAVLEEIEDDPRERIEAEMERRFSGADLSSRKERNRIFGYFARRGFAPHDIWGAINGKSSFDDVDPEYFEE